jgi:hypothetical protein
MYRCCIIMWALAYALIGVSESERECRLRQDIN